MAMPTRNSTSLGFTTMGRGSRRTKKTWRDASTSWFAARQVLPASQWPQLLAQHFEHPAARRHIANQSPQVLFVEI
jgi:hypothetical protein